MTSLWICPNILVFPKFDEWHQSDSDFTLNSDVKKPVKSTAHQSARFRGFQGLSCLTFTRNTSNLDVLIDVLYKKRNLKKSRQVHREIPVSGSPFS